jgi:thymidylate kinase
LPPAGRDIDLLVRPVAQRELDVALRAGGWHVRGKLYVRFADCTVDIVDVVAAGVWGLPPAELDRLFALATPLQGHSRLVEPSAHHVLLILAARTLGPVDNLSERRRARVSRALERDPRAWEQAAEVASAWGASEALRRLRGLYERKSPPPIPGRLRARARRARRGRVVALSGIDGAGKSTQSAALVETLNRLGYDAVSEWVPFQSNQWPYRVLDLIKRVVASAPLEAGDASAATPAGDDEADERTGPSAKALTTRLREGNGAITHGWATVIALANALSHARVAARHLAAGRIVVFDRYTLDSAVRMRFLYGHDRRFPVQNWLIGALSPRPVAAFFLDIDPEQSLQRKDDRWTARALTAHARLYRQEHERFGVVKLDGNLPREELCAIVARQVWERLPG